MNIKELKELIKDLPDESIIRFQRIEDVYIEGRNENHKWYGKTTVANDSIADKLQHREGWITYDMPCDVGKCSDQKEFGDLACMQCEHRNQYINATRGFIYDGELFLDGHW